MTRIAGLELDLEAPIPSGEDELWFTRCPIPTAFEIGLAQDRFAPALADLGLSWIQLTESDDPAVHQSHFTHRKASSFRHGGNVPAIFARAAGADTRVIGISWPRTSHPLLARKGSGIASPADLRGRRLLVPVRPEVAIDFWRASTLRVYDAALASAGLTFDDVELVEVVGEPHRMADHEAATPLGRQRWALRDRLGFQRAVLEPLVRGEVDAVTSQTTIAEELAALTGARVIYDQADDPDLLRRTNNGAPDVLTVSGALADEHPERVAAVIRILRAGARWAAEHPAETRELFAQRLQTPTTLLDVVYGDDLHQRLDISLPAHTAAVLQRQHDVLLAHGFIDAPFDVEAWIDPQPLALAGEIEARLGEEPIG